MTDMFPSDAVARAKKYLDAIGTTGAYSESNGATVFREEIAASLQVWVAGSASIPSPAAPCHRRTRMRTFAALWDCPHG